MFKHSPNEKGMIYCRNGIKPRWKRRNGANGIYLMVYRPNGKGMVYERFFIEVIMVKGKNIIVKDKINTVSKIKCQ